MQKAETIELIKERLPIADLIGRYVPLEPRGANFVAACPFHDETKPSFSVTPDSNCFYCFGCGKGGDIFTFWQEYHGVGFREALEQLAEMAGVQLDDDRRSQADAKKDMERRGRRRQAFGMYRFAQEHFQKNLASDAGADCRAYLQARGVPEDLQKRFGLGWALDDWHDLTGTLKQAGYDMKLAAEAGLVGTSRNSGAPFDPFRARLMFPIRDSAGTTIAFGGRVIDNASDQAKYVNTADSIIYKKGEHLFGLDLAGQAIRRTKRVFVTEGYMDVLTLHQFGYTNAVAGLGTALTDRQARRVLGYAPEIVLLYDGDGAGRKAAMAASERFLATGAKTRVVLLPEGEDIDSLLRRPGGQETFQSLQARAKPALQFCMETMRARSPREALQWCKDFIRSIQLPELVSPAITYLTQHLGFGESEFRRSLKDAGVSTARRDVPARAGQVSMSVLEEEILRCAVRYPERAGEIADMGAERIIASPFGCSLWDKVAEARPGEAGYDLEGEERAFWDRWRGPEAPDLDTPELELQALREAIDEQRRVLTVLPGVRPAVLLGCEAKPATKSPASADAPASASNAQAPAPDAQASASNTPASMDAQASASAVQAPAGGSGPLSAAEAMQAVQEDGMALAGLPMELRTADVCEAAVLRNPQALRFVPEVLRTHALVMLAIERDGTLLAAEISVEGKAGTDVPPEKRRRGDTRCLIKRRKSRYLATALQHGLTIHAFLRAQSEDLDRIPAGRAYAIGIRCGAVT
nr:DNA primase [Desulfovibrio sp.]